MIITDLSEKKQNEQLLRAKNLELERLNNSLEQFASIASHDLQEPLRKIKTFTSLLTQRFNDELPDKAKEFLNKIWVSSERMSLLIKDVLNFSRIVYSANMFIATDLNQILNNILQDFDMLVLDREASIRKNDLPCLEAIPVQINQLFYNLVGNALKFSKEGRPAVITISSRMLLPEEVAKNAGLNKQLSYTEISFKDNGIGFEQRFAEQIFAIFERLNHKQESSGTGIGLALCRKIAEQHQGRIRAESHESIGTTFYVLLPLKQNA